MKPIDQILEYLLEHRKTLFTARIAITNGNSSLAYDILGRSVKNLDDLIKKLTGLNVVTGETQL